MPRPEVDSERVDELRESRPEDALVEPLFAGLLQQETKSGEAPHWSRGRSARGAWIALALILAAGLVALALSL